MAGPTGALADRLVRRAMRTGLRRGLGDGNRLWLAVGAAAVGVRLLRRLTRPGPATVVTETLAPGQTIEVRHVPPAPRRSGGVPPAPRRSGGVPPAPRRSGVVPPAPRRSGVVPPAPRR